MSVACPPTTPTATPAWCARTCCKTPPRRPAPSGEWPRPEDAARHADAAVAALPVPDVLVLGMGADGHTASLFAGSPDLARALDLATPDKVCAVRLPEPPPHPPHPRLTLTLAQILRARRILLPVQGADKLLMLGQAARDGHAPGPSALPVSHVLHQTTAPVDLWLPL